MLSSFTIRGELVAGLVSSSKSRGEKTIGHCQPNLSGVRNEIVYSVCTTTTAIPAVATSGNSRLETHDHFVTDFDRRFRRLLAGAAVVEASAAIIENFGRPTAALLPAAVGELLLRRVLVGAVVTDTGAAVIKDFLTNADDPSC